MNEVCNENKKLYRVFPILLIVCGLLVIFFTPPMAVPDENTHFFNAYAVSQASFNPSSDRYIFKETKAFPNYIYYFIQEYNSKYSGQLDSKFSFGESYFLSWLNVTDEGREYVYYDPAGTIIPWAYLFSGIGIALMRFLTKIFGDNYDTAYNLLLSARIANFMVYSIFGMVAVKITPVLKKTIMLLLIMPMSLFLGASTSYDSIIISVSVLFFAELMLLVNNETKRVDVKDIVIISVCALFMVSIKMVYAPLLLLLFFVPFSKFGTKKKYVISILCVVTSFIIGYVLPTLLIKISNRGLMIADIPEVDLQKQYLIRHIYLIPKIIFCTIKENSNFYLSGFFGKLGQLDTNFPIPILVSLGIVLLTTTLIECGLSKHLSKVFKVCTIVIVVVSVVLIFMAHYIGWTPKYLEVGGNIVTGVQGRYFIPLYCFAFIPLLSGMLKKIPSKTINQIYDVTERVTEISMLFIAISTPTILFSRYWV